MHIASFGGPLAKYTGFTTKNSVNYSPPDYIRFIHKWMADKFSQNSTDKTCQTNADCEKAAGICSNKRCVKSTTRFHESYGTGLEWDYNAGYFIVSNSSAPNWVQSNFDTTLLRLYKVDSPESQFIQLAFSILFAIGSILSVQQTGKWLTNQLQLQ
jgi:hypothetical protein